VVAVAHHRTAAVLVALVGQLGWLRVDFGSITREGTPFACSPSPEPRAPIHRS
jgi:hypothetical protein